MEQGLSIDSRGLLGDENKPKGSVPKILASKGFIRVLVVFSILFFSILATQAFFELCDLQFHPYAKAFVYFVMVVLFFGAIVLSTFVIVVFFNQKMSSVWARRTFTSIFSGLTVVAVCFFAYITLVGFIISGLVAEKSGMKYQGSIATEKGRFCEFVSADLSSLNSRMFYRCLPPLAMGKKSYTLQEITDTPSAYGLDPYFRDERHSATEGEGAGRNNPQGLHSAQPGGQSNQGNDTNKEQVKRDTVTHFSVGPKARRSIQPEVSLQLGTDSITLYTLDFAGSSGIYGIDTKTGSAKVENSTFYALMPAGESRSAVLQFLPTTTNWIYMTRDSGSNWTAQTINFPSNWPEEKKYVQDAQPGKLTFGYPRWIGDDEKLATCTPAPQSQPNTWNCTVN